MGRQHLPQGFDGLGADHRSWPVKCLTTIFATYVAQFSGQLVGRTPITVMSFRPFPFDKGRVVNQQASGLSMGSNIHRGRFMATTTSGSVIIGELISRR